MTGNYQPLWKDVTSANDEGEAVRTLMAGIVLDREGRAFISSLERVDPRLCVEILDHVSRDLYLFPSFVVSGSFFRASQSTTSELQRNSFSPAHLGGLLKSMGDCQNP